MKTIVIRPEVIAYHNAAFRHHKPPVNRTLIVACAALPLVALAGWLAGRTTTASAPATTPPVTAFAPVVPAARQPSDLVVPKLATLLEGETVELSEAMSRGLARATFTGNGRERIAAEVANLSGKPLSVRVSFGQMFASGRNLVVATRNASVAIDTGKTVVLPVQAAATRSTNVVGKGVYQLSQKTTPKIDLLLAYAQDHPELPTPALQTAILALTENLPLGAVCKFATSTNDLPTRFDTAAFRVETADLLTALSTLRDLGVRDRDLAMTVDPQLRVEAMVDPLCRAAAMRYYRITTATEWAFWKSQLLEGDLGTRHYALYGIARYFPDVAIEMLPQWVREKRTTQVFRLAAVQALGETNRPEALPILAGLVGELGRHTELGRTALEVAQRLEGSLQRATGTTQAVAFRGSIAANPF